jgi:peptidoglycan/LPS O-acetylase OafA/YrhL
MITPGLTTWLVPLLEYVGVLLVLYGVPALIIRLFSPRTEASLELAASPRVQLRFQPYMEGLRGLMAINVFIVHGASLYALSHGGDFFPAINFHRQTGVAAVCLFFFMTGYLLWKGIIDRPQFSRARYLRGRFLRTWPLYSVAISLVFLFALWRNSFHLVQPLWKFILSYLAWLAFALPGGPAINGIHDVTSIGAGVFWTLQMDWVFYLILPFLIWFTRRRWRLTLIIVPAVILHLVIDAHHFAGAIARFGIFLNFFVWCFCFGMFGAVIKTTWPDFAWARTRWASALAAALYLVTLCFVHPAWGRQESLILFPFFLLIAYGTDVFGLLNLPVSVFMGRISYSIYLLHALVLFAIVYALGPRLGLSHMGWLQFWAMLTPIGLLAIGVSTLTHRWIELPGNALGRTRPASAAIPSAASASPAQIQSALQEEAAELPGMAEAEILLSPADKTPPSK